MVKASCPPGGVVLDLFMGSGTTAIAAKRSGRDFVGFELNADYCDIIRSRLEAGDAHPAKKPVQRKPAKKRAGSTATPETTT
jgi:site-specific DNA-methyltransferase (adenine-specific)